MQDLVRFYGKAKRGGCVGSTNSCLVPSARTAVTNAGVNWSTSLNMTSHSPLLPNSTIETPRKLTLKNNRLYKTIPRTIKTTFFRIVIFYILTILTASFCINYQDPTLLTSPSHMFFMLARGCYWQEKDTPGIFVSRMVLSQHLREPPPHTSGSAKVRPLLFVKFFFNSPGVVLPEG